MAYNLPPAWDPGFALPKYVRQEGLQRRAFVTKQMPRGTYDDPNVKTGGYDVPQYVTDEGYGQGTLTTRWQPSGTYSGPKIPHYLNRRPQVIADTGAPGGTQKITMIAPAIGMPANEGQAVSMGAADAFGWLRAILGIGKARPLPPVRQPGQALHGLGGIAGDAPMPDPFPSYGQVAAMNILARMQMLPTNQRAKYLKKTLATIDPSLEARTGKIARDLRRQGMNSAQALHAGLSRAMSAGMLAELTLRGQGKRPSGLSGCTGYTGCSAMGSAAPMAGYSKRAARRSLGATSAAATSAAAGGLTNVSSISTSNTVVSPTEITVGPFKFDPAHGSYAVDFASPNQIPAAARPWILKQLTTPLGDDGAYKNPWPASQLVGPGAPQSNSYYHCGSRGCNAGDPGAQLVNLVYQGPTAADFYAAVGLTPDMTVEGGNSTFDMDKITQNSDGTLSYDSQTFTTAPAVKFRSDGSDPPVYDVPPSLTNRQGVKHSSPDDKDWGMWMFIMSNPYTVTANPDGSQTVTFPPSFMRLIFAPLPQQAWWQPLWDLIAYVPSKLSDAAQAVLTAVNDAVAAVGGLACSVLTQPGAANAAAQGAGKANPVYGAAAGAGVTVGSALCGGTQVPTCPDGYMWNGISQCIAIPQPTNWTLIALLGGGAVLAAALAKKSNRKKKAAAAAGGTVK